MPTASGSAVLEDSSRSKDALVDMGQRVLSALVALPPIIAIIWVGEPWYTPAVAVVTLLATWEFYSMAASAIGGNGSIRWIGSIGSVLFVANARLGGPFTGLLITLVLLSSFVGAIANTQERAKFTSWLWYFGGVMYVGWVMAHFVLLRGLGHGRELILLVLLCAFATDTSAFLVGRNWGKRRLAPDISPAKTWEGAVAGLAGALVSCIALVNILVLPITLAHAIALGAIVGVFSQVGDLSESMIKRSTGAKDSGTLIPGHGGILDRLDSLVFTVPLIYYYSVWLLGG